MGKTTQGIVNPVASTSCTSRRCHIEAEPGERAHRCRAPLSLGRCLPSRPGPRGSLFRRVPGASFRAGKKPGGVDESGVPVTAGGHTPLRTPPAVKLQQGRRKTRTGGAELASCHHVLTFSWLSKALFWQKAMLLIAPILQADGGAQRNYLGANSSPNACSSAATRVSAESCRDIEDKNLLTSTLVRGFCKMCYRK